MQIENNYDKDVYNGDIGFVSRIDPDEQELTATFGDHIVTHAFGELDELVLCCATTIHKSRDPSIRRWSFPSRPSTT